ncbi:hypothetical protein DM860_014055 [Cuscuta australis]|uniref:DUF4378 domain-containing protein n=1 Tax=Cuscuta australis TaxID=267555 RepID=A0A328DI16_9ASTE|nr:hypothetical protein DM860_014055 [Cuscuta australis]
MGKNLQKQSGLSLNTNHQPKCMWGIMHHLHHNRWITAKKRLPYRKRGGSKHNAVGEEVLESKATTSGNGEMFEMADEKMENSNIEAKTAESSSTSKSMKSRLRALITEEVSKRRGRARHRRSSSCPTRGPPIKQSNPMILPPHPPLDVNALPQTSASEETSEHDKNVSISSLLDPPLPKISRHGHVPPNITCDSCVAILQKMNDLKQIEVGIHGQTGTASLQESKLFLKALDLLNMRKEVFLKILQDPCSSLSHRLHDRRTTKLRQGLGKSLTFPSHGSLLGEEDCRFQAATECDAVEKRNLCTDPKLLDNVSRLSPNEQKSRHGSGHCLKHFQNLRDKLKFVIKESRKERQRIVMDAVIDKIPRGRRMPKQVEQGSIQFHSSFLGRTETQCLNKASPPNFHESAERYNQLLESCCRTSGPPSPSTRSPKVLERILSLPDLRYCYSTLRNDDSQHDTLRRYGEGNQMHIPLGSESRALSEANSDENQHDSFQDANHIETITCCDASHSSLPDMNLHDTWAHGQLFAGQPTEAKTQTSTEVEKKGSPVKEMENILMHLHVDDKNKAQFDYVKDILEMSGFSRIEFLESWHSAELPLSPSVFKLVEGCLLEQPGCGENEAGDNCDHLLLFDLISDVLLEMYERSHSYWPKSLTCHSHISRTPLGYHVLEEVWANVNWLLSWSHDLDDQSLDDVVCRDLAKGNNWMNLQFDGECIGLELEELILDDLLDELIFDDLLF